MKVQIKNSNFQPSKVQSLFEYFKSIKNMVFWDYMGLTVELDPTIDFKGNNALIRWTDIQEGFNDKLIVNSLEEFTSHFKQINA